MQQSIFVNMSRQNIKKDNLPQSLIWMVFSRWKSIQVECQSPLHDHCTILTGSILRNTVAGPRWPFESLVRQIGHNSYSRCIAKQCPFTCPVELSTSDELLTLKTLTLTLQGRNTACSLIRLTKKCTGCYLECKNIHFFARKACMNYYLSYSCLFTFLK